jgi:hypothetical protein
MLQINIIQREFTFGSRLMGNAKDLYFCLRMRLNRNGDEIIKVARVNKGGWKKS